MSGGDYSVTGDNTYAEDSVTPYPITVNISDPADNAGTSPTTLTLDTTADVSEGPNGEDDMTGQGVAVQASEGTAFKAVEVATFNDPISHGGQPDPTSEYTVKINWGDG